MDLTLPESVDHVQPDQSSMKPSPCAGTVSTFGKMLKSVTVVHSGVQLSYHRIVIEAFLPPLENVNRSTKLCFGMVL